MGRPPEDFGTFKFRYGQNLRENMKNYCMTTKNNVCGAK